LHCQKDDVKFWPYSSLCSAAFTHWLELHIEYLFNSVSLTSCFLPMLGAYL
jgi:hypothetical protein